MTWIFFWKKPQASLGVIKRLCNLFVLLIIDPQECPAGFPLTLMLFRSLINAHTVRLAANSHTKVVA